MPPTKQKSIVLDFSDCSGGVSSLEHPLRIRDNQVQPATLGCILKKSGFEKYPGSVGLSASTTFTTYLRMLEMYRDLSGTERLLALSDGELSLVDQDDGSLSLLYDLGGTGEGWACDSHGKKFIVNGTAAVKVESGTAYQIGITPPSGVSVAAATGAGLDDGDYTLYATYARRVSGQDVLHSVGEYLGTVTLGSGNNQIDITSFADSSDVQVGQKAIWIKRVTAGDDSHFFFYATDNNTTTSFTIDADTDRDATRIYETEALSNNRPPDDAEFIYAFTNRIWMLKSNILYYSEKAYNVYDLEKFPAEFYLTLPHRCTGIFSIGYNLYVNTDDGIIAIPDGDATASPVLIEPRWHFQYMRTVDRWAGGVIGVTNDGVRVFDGANFTSYDLSITIKKELDSIYAYNANFQPCGFIFKRDHRTEYHVLWRDAARSTVVNNRRAVLNMDSYYYVDPENYTLAWEFQPFTGNYATIKKSSNTLFIGQSHAAASKVYAESTVTDLSVYCYDYMGSLLASETEHMLYFKSKVIVPDLRGFISLWYLHLLSQNQGTYQIRIVIADRYGIDSSWVDVSEALGTGGIAARFDETNFDESYFPVDDGTVFKKKIKEISGRSCYIEIRQIANDPDFKLLQVLVSGEHEMGRYT